MQKTNKNKQTKKQNLYIHLVASSDDSEEIIRTLQAMNAAQHNNRS